MRFTTGLTVVAVLGAVACKKNDGSAGTGSGSGGSGSAVVSMPPPAPPDAAVAAGPWKVPAGARPADEKADATALGPAVIAHFVERVQKTQSNGARYIKLVLVLEGVGGAIAADVTDTVVAQDGAKEIMAISGEADVVLAPVVPPRPFAESDASPPLEFKGPLMFVAHFISRREKRDVVIAQDKDAIAVWTMIAASDSVDVAPEWEQTGAIKLAPGTKVTAPALVGGHASAPDPSAHAARGSLAATALDDALGAKGITSTSVETRADKPASQWAAVKAKIKATTGAVTTYAIWRVTSAGVNTFDLVAPSGKPSTWFDELSAIDVKDMDGDGVDDAVITAKWSRRVTGKSKDGEVTTLEHVNAVYVVGGPQLGLGAQHATAYKTETNLEPGENPQPEESIAFTYALVPGPPLVLHVEVGASEVLPKNERVKGLLDPKRDPWLTAADLPIVFK